MEMPYAQPYEWGAAEGIVEMDLLRVAPVGPCEFSVIVVLPCYRSKRLGTGN